MSNASAITPPSTGSFNADRLRVAFLCLFAASVSLGVAVVSLAKILLLCYLPFEIWLRARRGVRSEFSILRYSTTPVIVLALAYLAATILWTDIPKSEALKEWFRHSRMLSLILVIYLLRSHDEAIWVLRWFVGTQIFAMLSSWMLWLGLPVPWATYDMAKHFYGVFSSYLEQSVMTVVALTLGFYFREAIFPVRYGRWIASVFLLLGAANVVLILPSMTGYIALGAAVLAILIRLVRSNSKLLAGVVVGILLLGGAGYSKVAQRVEKIQAEINLMQSQGVEDSSTGKRLNYWTRSWQSFKEAPIAGHGVGSWNHEYNRMGGGVGGHSAHIRSPHSEYFLWLVEGGVIGLILLMTLLFTLECDRRQLNESACQAMLPVILILTSACLVNGMLVGIGTGEFFCVALAVLLCIGWKQQQNLNS